MQGLLWEGVLYFKNGCNIFERIIFSGDFALKSNGMVWYN